MWNPWSRATGVVVRGGGFPYACRREGDGRWTCGRCERGRLEHPQVGRRCPACEAEVVGVQRGFDFWTLVLALVTLLAAWAGLAWWH